jgi:hypothetical protein
MIASDCSPVTIGNFFPLHINFYFFHGGSSLTAASQGKLLVVVSMQPIWTGLLS